MKMILIAYKGTRPSNAEIRNGLLSFGILDDNAVVQCLSDESFAKIVAPHIGDAIMANAPKKQPSKVEKAAKILINAAQGITRPKLAKTVIPFYDGSHDPDYEPELRIAIKEVTSGDDEVSDEFLEANGTNRSEWNKAMRMLSSFTD